MLWPLYLALLVLRVSAEDPTMDEEAYVTTEDDDLQNLRGIPGFENIDRLPTPVELLNMLDKIPGLSNEQKTMMREGLLNKIRQDDAAGYEAFMEGQEQAPTKDAPIPFALQTITLLGLISVLALIFVFFGYKLYKSLTDRERKREEKRKMKQMKKKK